MTGLPPSVAEFFDATNAADVERLVSAFAPDGSITDGSRLFAGHDAVRRWTEAESIGLAQTLEVTSFRVLGHGITVNAQVGGGGFTGPSTFAFVVAPDGSAIRTLTIAP